MKKIIIQTSFLFFLFSSLCFTQPDYFQYKNLTLIGQLLPTSETPKNVILYLNYAITVSETEIQVYNCEDINNPIIVNHKNYTSESMGITEVSIVGDYLVIVGNNKIKIFNIINLTNLEEEYSAENLIDANLGHEVKTITNSKIYYSLGNSLVIYDIENPLKPILKGNYVSPTRINGIMASDTSLIYLSTMKGIDIIDISDLDEPKYLKTYDENRIYGKGTFFGEYLAVTDISTANIILIDVNNYLEPLEKNFYYYGGSYAEKMVFYKNFLMASSNFHPSSLSIYDITDLSNHGRVAKFYNGSKGYGFGIAVKDNLIYYCGFPNSDTPTTNHGLFILRNDLISSVEEDEQVSNKIELNQNYPNPFNPNTVIKYQIPMDEKRESKNLKLIIYDALGKEVATLVNKKQSPGNYQVEFVGSNLPSGVYFYRLQTNNYIVTKKMVLLR